MLAWVVVRAFRFRKSRFSRCWQPLPWATSTLKRERTKSSGSVYRISSRFIVTLPGKTKTGCSRWVKRPENLYLLFSDWFQVFMDTYDLFVKLHEESDPSECMISPHQFGMLMLDWTNSQKAASMWGWLHPAWYSADIESYCRNSTSIPRNVHADLAVDILKALYVDERSGAYL